MLQNIYWLLNYVRENILEKFMLPELNISYWDFCIYLAIAGVVIVVLINAVRVSGSSAISNSERRKANSYSRYKENRSRLESHNSRYNSENGG